jgi:hypothetical protein
VTQGDLAFPHYEMFFVLHEGEFDGELDRTFRGLIRAKQRGIQSYEKGWMIMDTHEAKNHSSHPFIKVQGIYIAALVALGIRGASRGTFRQREEEKSG